MRFAVTFFLFLAGQAYAVVPKLGDKVVFNNIIKSVGYNPLSYETSKTILDVKPADETHPQKYLVLWTTSTRTTQDWVTDYALGYIENLAEFCRLEGQQQGQPAQLEELTLPLGTLPACKVESTDGQFRAWYSDQVPFGLLRQDFFFEDGDSFHSILKQYH